VRCKKKKLKEKSQSKKLIIQNLISYYNYTFFSPKLYNQKLLVEPMSK